MPFGLLPIKLTHSWFTSLVNDKSTDAFGLLTAKCGGQDSSDILGASYRHKPSLFGRSPQALVKFGMLSAFLIKTVPFISVWAMSMKTATIPPVAFFT